MEGALAVAAGVAYLGLGSNVGDRVANLRAASTALDTAGVTITARASLYETAPQGEILAQPDFVNSVVQAKTDLVPHDLLDLCKRIEHDLGRDPDGVHHGPRPIDIDVLLLGDLVYASERICLPHREITTRRFVLEPLLEITPDLVLPGTGMPLARAMSAVVAQPVSRIGKF